MPLITAKRAGRCAACGGGIRKAEQAVYTAEGGIRHVEPQCAQATTAPYRTNSRSGTCVCGTWVAAEEGFLVHLGERKPGARRGPTWGVRCSRCSP
jgi:hypothetical protein